MKLIAAVDSGWGIGNKRNLLVSIPGDHRVFRRETEGKVVILGRRTLETFPQGLPLQKRTNVILSRDPSFQAKGAVIVRDLNQLTHKLAEYDTQQLYVIGGESVYRQLLPYCDTALVTKIDWRYEADAFFPNLDEDPEWRQTEESEEQTYFDITYRFVRYERTAGLQTLRQS